MAPLTNNEQRDGLKLGQKLTRERVNIDGQVETEIYTVVRMKGRIVIVSPKGLALSLVNFETSKGKWFIND